MFRCMREVAARVKQNISRARSSAVILAFMAGKAALLGAIDAWGAAITASRYRDGREPIPYLLDWSVGADVSRESESSPSIHARSLALAPMAFDALGLDTPNSSLK
jgi:hypothetical protein